MNEKYAYKDKQKCPNCGEWIDIKSRNCKYCGVFISKTSIDYTYQISKAKKNKTIILEEKKQCRHCGELNNINAVVCYNCNESLKDAKIFKRDNNLLNDIFSRINKKNKRYKNLRISYFIVICIVITVLLVFTMLRINSFNNIILSENNNLAYSSKLIDSTSYFFRYILGYIILFICMLNNFHPEILFYFNCNYAMMVRDAEPSDYYYSITKVGSYILSFGVLVYLLCDFYNVIYLRV